MTERGAMVARATRAETGRQVAEIRKRLEHVARDLGELSALEGWQEHRLVARHVGSQLRTARTLTEALQDLMTATVGEAKRQNP